MSMIKFDEYTYYNTKAPLELKKKKKFISKKISKSKFDSYDKELYTLYSIGRLY